MFQISSGEIFWPAIWNWILVVGFKYFYRQVLRYLTEALSLDDSVDLSGHKITDFVVIQTCWARQISRWLLNSRIFEFHFWIVEANLTKIATAENPRNDSFSIVVRNGSPWNSFAFTIQQRFERFGCFQASLVLKVKSRGSNGIVFSKCLGSLPVYSNWIRL